MFQASVYFCGNSKRFVLTLLPRRVCSSWRTFLISSLCILSIWGETASPLHGEHSQIIKSKRLKQPSTLCICQIVNCSHILCSLSERMSVSTRLSSCTRSFDLSQFHCHHLCWQHCWQCGGELWHRKWIWRFWNQRRGKLCGQVCCSLRRQGVHRERSHPGTHQEPTQHDPRYNVLTLTQIPFDLHWDPRTFWAEANIHRSQCAHKLLTCQMALGSMYILYILCLCVSWS